MHFMKALDPEHLGAEHFVDDKMNPIVIKLVIESVTMAKPPAGGKEKICFSFVGKTKKAFFANTQIKKIPRALRNADTEGWKGAELSVTAAETKFKGQPVMGMKIIAINGQEVK